MSVRTKENFLIRHKKFLIGILIFYISGILLGIFLYHSPNFSHEYMQKYGEQHKIYREITKNIDYYKFIQRPHLFKGTPEELKNFQFALNYEHNPDFKKEQNRIFYYLLWFKTLNFFILITIVFHFGWKPLQDYISKYQRNILNKQNEITHLIKQKTKELDEAKSVYNTLPSVIKEREYYKESFLQQRLSEIEKQNKQAVEQIEFLLKTRKQEEILHCINELKKQLIEKSLKKAEEELMQSETPEKLTQTVEKFNFLITMIS